MPQPMGMSLLLHILGVVVVVTGLAWLATLAGIAQMYVAGAALIAFAVGIVLALLRSRQAT